MKINNSIILDKLYMDINDELLKEGDIVEGRTLNNIKGMEYIEPSNIEKDSISKILKKFYIKDDPIPIEIIETLMKYNAPINKENVVKGIRVYDKLEELLNAESSDLIRIIGFCIKFNIEPTLNNLRYILELEKDSNVFSEDFKILEEIIDKKFTNLVKRVNIDRGSPNIFIGKNSSKLKEVLNKIEEIIGKSNSLYDKKIRQTIKGLENKIEFIDEMNKGLSFVYLPLNSNKNNYNGLITLLKKRKAKDKSNEDLNIFINLNTRRLGQIKIFCQVIDSLMNIRFSNIDKEDFNLFRSKEEQLRDLVGSTGYRMGTIEYLFTNSYSLLDSLIVNQNPIYYLDVQV